MDQLCHMRAAWGAGEASFPALSPSLYEFIIQKEMGMGLGSQNPLLHHLISVCLCVCFLLLTTSPLSPPSFTFRNKGRGLLLFCFPPGSLTEDYWPWLVASLRLWEREWPEGETEGYARMSRNPLRGIHCVGAWEGLLLG